MARHAPKFRAPPETPFAARVQQALIYAKLTQVEAARLISIRLQRTVSAQAVQNMAVKAEFSGYTTDLAAVCGVDPEWLAQGIGLEPGTPQANPYAVREAKPHQKPPPANAGEKLAHLIEVRAISEKDLELLLDMAQRMAKHERNGA